MLSHKGFKTKGGECVTLNHCIQVLHFPASIIDFKQVNAKWVILNQMWYNTARFQCPVY